MNITTMLLLAFFILLLLYVILNFTKGPIQGLVATVLALAIAFITIYFIEYLTGVRILDVVFK